MPYNLDQIGTRHGTDKGTRHGYLNVYERLLARHKGTTAALLEIGYLRGESFRMWQEWLGGNITAIDILARPRGLGGGQYIQADAYCPETVALLHAPFKIIIDDGPHTIESMSFAAARYAPLLAYGGTFIIEDIYYPEWIPELVALLPLHLQPYAYVIDLNHRPHAWSKDDRLLVVDLPDDVRGTP